jgi:CubicO group peptidase (beta-lactamase class C family)
VYERAHGFADLEFTVNADPETMFRIGSVTKQFTGAAIVKLAERGKLSVDDPLSRFLPDYPRGDEITLRHLLTHTGGVPNYTNLGPKWEQVVARELSHEELVALWKDMPLDFEPGTKWNYSNSGYYLLGMVIEKVSGQGYDAFLRDTFFDPLKLTRTRYDSNGEVLLNRAQGYGFAEGKFWNDQLIGMSQPGAAGALISTAGDLVRWQLALVGGKVVAPASFEEMTLPYLLEDGSDSHYGFGLMIAPQIGLPCISHGGGIFGFNSYLAYWPEEKLSISVISNSEGLRSEELAFELARALTKK